MFWFRLAAHLGKTVRQLQAEMTSDEFTEWQAYYLMEPFGAAAEDIRHGVGMSMLANAHFASKDKSFSADEFMLGDAGKSADEAEPILLDDAVAQADLILTEVFRLPPRNTVA